MHQFASPTIQSLEPRTLLSAGALDPSYGPAAFENFRIGDYTPTVHAQLDGKMLHLGRMGRGLGVSKIWRTNPNGSLDTTFASSGVLKLGSETVADFQIQADGKIVTVMDLISEIELRRFTANGAPDTSFGRGGEVRFTAPSYAHYQHMAIQNDGKIVIVGYDSNNGLVRRFNTNGTVDTSFGNNGVVTILPTQDPGFGWVYMGGVDIRRADNRIVVTATDSSYHGHEQWEVLVLAPNGAREWLGSAPMAGGSRTGKVVVDGDGSILVAGQFTTNESSNPVDNIHDVLVRYPAPKSNAPVMWIDHRAWLLNVIVPQVDGRVLTIDDAQHVQRLNYNLTTDTSFGSGGLVTTGLAPFSIALQGDGKIVVDGTNFFTSQDPIFYHSIRLTGDVPSGAVSRKTLLVPGTAGVDDILIGSAKGTITVTVNGTQPLLFSRSTVRRIHIDAGDGNDTIHVAKSVPSAVINGGEGEDTLFGRRKRDKLSSIEHIK